MIIKNKININIVSFVISCLLVLFGFISGCQQRSESPKPEIAASIPVESRAVPIEVPATALVMFRSELYPDRELPKNYNIIYLPHRPLSTIQFQQYNKICELWLNSLSVEKDLKTYLRNNDGVLVPVYWSLTTKTSEVCRNLITHYDYARMRLLMTNLKLLIEQPMIVGVYGNVRTYLNLKYLTDTELETAFEIWREKLVVIPEKNEEFDAVPLLVTVKKLLSVIGDLAILKVKS